MTPERHTERRRDLSISYNKVGDIVSSQGNLGGALASYRAGLAIREALAKADPSNGVASRSVDVLQQGG